MTVRLRDPVHFETSINDLPQEVLSLPFSHLNLTDLLTVERVCKIWHKVSSLDQENWKRTAFQKGIIIDDLLPVRAQVLASFAPFCISARKVFSDLSTIAFDKHPIIEKQMIDSQIAKMDKSKMDPLHSLLDHLKIKDYPLNLIHVGSSLIHDCIEMIPVWQETGLLTIDEDLFFHLISEDGYLKKFQEGACLFIDKANQFIQAELTYEIGQPVPLMNFEFNMKNIEDLNKAIFSLTEYIFHFVKNPSPKMILNLCNFSAATQYLPVWHQIALIRNSHTEAPSPKGPEDAAWEKTFEEFLLKNSINVNVEIHYPPFLHTILKQMDSTDFEIIIESFPPYTPTSNNAYINYMDKQILKDYIQSFLSIRSCQL